MTNFATFIDCANDRAPIAQRGHAKPKRNDLRKVNVWTSAGVTAGIDLTLALVADDHGHQAAATVARQLIVYLQRSGGQAQLSALLAGQAANTELVRDLLARLRDHLTNGLSVAALARQINLSEYVARRGPYRILYNINDTANRVEIARVDHRADVYRSG
ncbi:MAG: type II toxin-antitoxin system RelE/ParE family toxin [Dermatophilaceae bacterium]|nr:type II toxin-antitoxin system RelE/ParE family toxin [Dermatophilaceae bacterium]